MACTTCDMRNACYGNNKLGKKITRSKSREIISGFTGITLDNIADNCLYDAPWGVYPFSCYPYGMPSEDETGVVLAGVPEFNLWITDEHGIQTFTPKVMRDFIENYDNYEIDVVSEYLGISLNQVLEMCNLDIDPRFLKWLKSNGVFDDYSLNNLIKDTIGTKKFVSDCLSLKDNVKYRIRLAFCLHLNDGLDRVCKLKIGEDTVYICIDKQSNIDFKGNVLNVLPGACKSDLLPI